MNKKGAIAKQWRLNWHVWVGGVIVLYQVNTTCRLEVFLSIYFLECSSIAMDTSTSSPITALDAQSPTPTS